VLALEAGAARVVVAPEGGAHIERIDVDGLALLVPPEVDDHNYGCFPMAPWAGRVRNGSFAFDGVEHQLPRNKPPHAIHGIVRDRRWHVDHEDPTRAVLSVDLNDPWPFPGRVVYSLELAPDSLALTMEVHAARGVSMPASCGWHPWWHRDLARGGPVELDLHADRMYELDDDGIPTGELIPVHGPPWDDCFTDLGTPAAMLKWPGAATLTIETDCPDVVVYTEPEEAVCVEPQSGPPDELNLAPHVVGPDSPLVVHATFHWAIDG
jgi:galactose mutarotase-like enzyme